MNRQYYSLFRHKKLHHEHLRQHILQLFTNTDPHQPLNLDQLLFLLDQRSTSHKSSRDVGCELFSQAQNRNHKASLSQLVSKYIQNIELSRVCLLRDEARLRQLKVKDVDNVGRDKSFIFFKLLNVSVYTSFSKSTTLQYKIDPTDIPLVTINNAHHSVLNHQFVLEMEEPQFQLILYSSGIQILKWSFPDEPDLAEGEYSRVINTQHAGFQAKIKYLPRGRGQVSVDTQKEIGVVESQLLRQNTALRRLCSYQPFLEGSGPLSLQEDEQQKGCLSFWTTCFPILKKYVLVIYWLSVILILLQALTSSLWPAQFLDIMVLFYLLGILSNCKITSYKMTTNIIQLTLVLLVLKSIWGATYEPLFINTSISKALVIFCIIFKIVLALVLFLLKDDADEVREQCALYVLGREKKVEEEPEVKGLEYDIWDD